MGNQAEVSPSVRLSHMRGDHTLWHLRNLGRTTYSSWPADVFSFGSLAVGYLSCSEGVVVESAGENQERRSSMDKHVCLWATINEKLTI